MLGDCVLGYRVGIFIDVDGSCQCPLQEGMLPVVQPVKDTQPLTFTSKCQGELRGGAESARLQDVRWYLKRLGMLGLGGS